MTSLDLKYLNDLYEEMGHMTSWHWEINVSSGWFIHHKSHPKNAEALHVQEVINRLVREGHEREKDALLTYLKSLYESWRASDNPDAQKAVYAIGMLLCENDISPKDRRMREEWLRKNRLPGLLEGLRELLVRNWNATQKMAHHIPSEHLKEFFGEKIPACYESSFSGQTGLIIDRESIDIIANLVLLTPPEDALEMVDALPAYRRSRPPLIEGNSNFELLIEIARYAKPKKRTIVLRSLPSCVSVRNIRIIADAHDLLLVGKALADISESTDPDALLKIKGPGLFSWGVAIREAQDWEIIAHMLPDAQPGDASAILGCGLEQVFSPMMTHVDMDVEQAISVLLEIMNDSGLERQKTRNNVLDYLPLFSELVRTPEDLVKVGKAIVACAKKNDEHFLLVMDSMNHLHNSGMITEIRDRKDKANLFRSALLYILSNKQYAGAMLFYMRYKKRGAFDFFRLVADIDAMDIDIPQRLLGLCKPIVYMSEEELRNAIGDEGESPLVLIYQKLCRRNGSTARRDFEENVGKMLDNSRGEKAREDVTKALGNEVFLFFDRYVRHEITVHIRNDFDLSSYDETLFTPLFKEAYKMYRSTEFNKEQAKELLTQYLRKNTYPHKQFMKSYPQTKQENKEWMKRHPVSWMKKNERTYVLEQEDYVTIDTERINHHLNVANEILKQIGIDETLTVENYSRFELPDSARKHGTLAKDFEMQLNNITAILKGSRKAKTVKEVTIVNEQDPMRVLMMGNWVENSCLSFYSNTKNFWSVFTNALEANKNVYYILNGEEVMGRFILAVDESDRIVQFKIYYARSGYDFQRIVDNHTAWISQITGFGLGGVGGKVELLFCENWYFDSESNES